MNCIDYFVLIQKNPREAGSSYYMIKVLKTKKIKAASKIAKIQLEFPERVELVPPLE